MQVTGNNIPFHHKSIRLCMDGLSFFQADAWKRIDFAPTKTPGTASNLRMEQAFAHYLCTPHAAQNCNPTHILLENPYTIVVPYGLFAKEEALQAFRFHFPEADATQFVVMWQNIPTFHMSLVFAVPLPVYHLAQQVFTQVKWQHYLAGNLEHCLKESKQQGGKQVWITVHQSFVHIALTQNGNLLFTNHFDTTHLHDILYYCATVYEQFDLSQQETPAYVLNSQEAFNTLQPHLTHCYFKEPYAYC